MEKIIPVSAGEEIKRPLAREKNKQKLMSTWQLNERKKKFECHMKPKNQQENEEYNEDKKQQITLKKKNREERTWNSGRCAEGREKKMRKSDRSFGQKSSVGQVKVLNEGLVGGHSSKIAQDTVFFP